MTSEPSNYSEPSTIINQKGIASETLYSLHKATVGPDLSSAKFQEGQIMTTSNPDFKILTFYDDKESFLESLNDEFARFILPAIVFIVMLMLLGLVGNVYVLYVYSKKNCNRTIIRFIQALAVFDLLSCAIAMPGEIMDMGQNYTFGDSLLCPTFRTVNLFCTMASGSTLVVVAVDRYRRICYPLQTQIRPKIAGYMLIALSIICIILSMPSAIVFGSKSVETPVSYINGSDCSISDSIADTPIPLVFNGFQLLLFLIGALALIIIYSLIARTICHQARQRKKRSRNRRRSLKNGTSLSPSHTRSEISSPSSPCTGNSRFVFKYPDAVKDNVLDLSDVIAIPHDPPSNGETDVDVDKSLSGVKYSSHVLRTAHSLSPFDAKNYTFVRSNSITSSTSGIETDITSATTSPPDTPIDVQRLEVVSLLKQRCPPNGLAVPPHSYRLSGDKGNGYRPLSKESSDKIPEIDDTDHNANKTIYENTESCDDGKGDESQNNQKQEVTKSPEEHRVMFTTSKNAGKEQCEKTAAIPFDNGQVVLRNTDNTINDQVQKCSRLKSHRMSLVLPPPKRKVVFRSSSLGHEDTKDRQKPVEVGKDSQSDKSDSGVRENSIKRRRLSSVRGLKDFRKLTLSEYQGTVRTTFMLFLITVIYILSFLPHLVLMTFKVIGEEGGSWEVARNIIVRSYFINSVANPIIYSFCSRNFFSQCRHPSVVQSGTLTR